MKLHTSGEDYLKTIYILQKSKEMVRSVDVAAYMGVSKPSVSHAVKLLQEGGFIVMNDDYTLHLTDSGQEIAKSSMSATSILRSSLPEQGLTPVPPRQKPVKRSTRSVMIPFRSSRDRNKKTCPFADPCDLKSGTERGP